MTVEMSDRDLFLLSQSIAGHLAAPNNEHWRAWPNKQGRCVDISRPANFALRVYPPFNGRLQVQGLFLGLAEYASPLTITTDLAKSTPEIAADLSTRLLPRYYAAYSAAVAKKREHEDRLVATRAIASELIAAGRGLLALPPTRQERNGTSIELLNALNHCFRIHAEGIIKSGAVSLKLDSLPPGLACRVVRLIADELAPKSPQGETECQPSE